MNNDLIWEIDLDTNTYQVFDLVDRRIQVSELEEQLSGGKPLAKSWQPLEIAPYQEDVLDAKKPFADFMMGFTFPMMHIKAINVLAGLMEKQVEFLPLKTEIGQYFLLNIEMLDCLNDSKSIVKRFTK